MIILLLIAIILILCGAIAPVMSFLGLFLALISLLALFGWMGVIIVFVFIVAGGIFAEYHKSKHGY